jgi:hypothetical protein
MHRNEAQFCRDEAEKLKALARECSDRKVRAHLESMAREWIERAKAKENLERA